MLLAPQDEEIALLCYIGEKVLLDGVKCVVVQDVNRLAQTAMVGAPDPSGIVWDPLWVETDRLKRLPGSEVEGRQSPN